MHHIVIGAPSINDGIFNRISNYYNNENYTIEFNINQQIELISNLTETLYVKLEKNKDKYKEFWDNYLTDIEPLNLNFLQIQPATAIEEINPILEIKFNYGGAELLKLNQIKRRYLITPYIYSLCIFAFLLNRHTNQERLAISYPIAVKEGTDFIYGAQVNTNLISYQFDAVTTIVDLFNQSKSFFSSSKGSNIKHSYYPISNILQGKNSSLLNVAFVQTKFKEMPFAFHDITKVEIQNEFNIDLANCFIFEQSWDNFLYYRVRYNKLMINQELIGEFIKCYQKLFLEILEDLFNDNVQKPLVQYNILSPEQYHQLIYKFNKTEATYSVDKTIHQLFEKQVFKTPDKIALVYKNTKLTYQKLNQCANQLANYLLSSYIINPDDLIVLCLERSKLLLVSVLAILKTGGAYVPIDSNSPSNRISYILQNTKAKILLTNERHKKKLQAISKSSIVQPKIVTVDSTVLKNKIIKQKNTNLVTKTNSKNLIYVIYTSGTTGIPKGVMIEHRNVVNYIFSIVSKYDDIDNVDFSGNIAFDLTVTTTLFPLVTGKTVFVYDGELRDINEYVFYINKNCIQFIKLTPSILLNIPYDLIIEKLKVCMVGGEKLTTKVSNHALRFAEKIVDEYGPTETTVGATSYLIFNDSQKLNIGKPYTNYKIYILNERELCLLPIGAIGEIFVGGAGLARGYLNQLELTAEKFIANPFQTNEEKKQNKNSRLYKTGDLSRWLPDGNLEYIGRNDSQVKIRGYRIELGEIENQLLHYPEIKQAIVLAKKRGNEITQNLDGEYLVAYYVAYKKLDEMKIYRHLEKHLPIYMLPNVLIYLNKLPLTINGKLDQAALPEAKFESNSEYIAPRTEKEKIICRAFSTVLEIEKIGINDDFFKLGGESLKAITLVSILQTNFNISVTNLFNLRTPQNIAEHVQSNEKNTIKEKLEQIKSFYKNRSGKYELDEYSQNKINCYFENIKTLSIDYFLQKKITNVLLTGVTGFLGCNILNQLLKLTNYKIFLLIRAESLSEAIARINNKFKFYFGKSLDSILGLRVLVFKADIEKKDLDLSSLEYKNLINTIDSVIHAAALVKHYGEYDKFYSVNVTATINLLEFTKLIKTKDFHYISTISILNCGFISDSNYNRYVYTEDDLPDSTQQYDNFYLQTKLQGEQQTIAYRKKGININIYRVGNLAFIAETGRVQENIEDNAFFHWLKYLLVMQKTTDEFNLVEISPADFTAQAIVKLFDKEHLKNNNYHVFNHNLIKLSAVISENLVNIDLVTMDNFIDSILGNLDNNVYYSLNMRFLLHQGWLDEQYMINIYKFIKFKVLQDKTANILKHLGFEWKPITCAIFNKYLKILNKL